MSIARVTATILMIVAATVLGANAAFTQEFPSKPIRIITGNVGGGNDFVSRQISQGITGPLGQAVIVENRSGNQPAETVAKAPPDGYTFLCDGVSFWIGPLFQKLSYDPTRDFTPIAILVRAPSIVVVHPSLPVKSVKELIALAKAKPGELNLASDVVGGNSYLAGELFKAMAGVNMVGVPYKGSGAGISAVVSGEMQVAFDSVTILLPYIKSGRVRALAVTTPEPSALLPNLPTVAATVPGYATAGSMSSAFAPAKTPAAIISRLNREIVRFLRQPEVTQRFADNAVEVAGSSPEELGTTIKSASTAISKLIKVLGTKVD